MKFSQAKKLCSVCLNYFSVYNYRKNIAKYCGYECYWKSLQGGKGYWLGMKRPGLNSGHKMSTEQKQQYSKRLKGKPIPWLHTEETALKRRKAVLKGKKHPFWKGGVTPLYKVIRKSPEYKQWRLSVFERDNYICQHCGITGGNGKRVDLQADHIKPFSLYPLLRFDINNGQTLCIPCHQKTSTFGSKSIYKPITGLNSVNP